jgi:hypothetical protein
MFVVEYGNRSILNQYVMYILWCLLSCYVSLFTCLFAVLFVKYLLSVVTQFTLRAIVTSAE